MNDETSLEEHRSFLNRYYGTWRGVYDLTRKYYLLGRDGTLDRLAHEPWQTLVEVGPGTGRNLEMLRRVRPDARLGGLEACDAMMGTARARLPGVTIVQGFAETADVREVLGHPPDRVLFAYSLSMIADWRAALRNARAGLANAGSVVVVDFGSLDGLPGWVADRFRRFLSKYRVTPLRPADLRSEGGTVRSGPLGYYVEATFEA